jgi:hypothetical protein
LIKHASTRMIFLNTPLDDAEQEQLQRFFEELQRQGKACPPSMRTYTLRLIQHAGGNIQKAIQHMEKNMRARLRWQPLIDNSILPDLQAGAMYWGGRDVQCRPCLVIRAARIDRRFIDNPDRICQVAVFLLDFMIRYGLCPGRVENWGVIVDLDGASIQGMPSMRLLSDLVDSLQGMYRFRMAWTKIINAPRWFSGLWAMIKSVIPGESIKKVEILDRNFTEVLQKLFVPAQLERKYGGAAPDRSSPSDFFPPQFSPGPFATTTPASAALEHGGGVDTASLHEHWTGKVAEGALWVRGDEASWLQAALDGPLTTAAAHYLSAEYSAEVLPCDSLDKLLRKLGLHQPPLHSQSPLVSLSNAVIAPIVPELDGALRLPSQRRRDRAVTDCSDCTTSPRFSQRLRAASCDSLRDGHCFLPSLRLWCTAAATPSSERSLSGFHCRSTIRRRCLS